jgi:hypothetical protein
VRYHAIGELVNEFEAALAKVESDIWSVSTMEEVQALHHRDTATAIGDKLIRGLMQLNSRDDAEAWAAKIDVSGIQSKYTRSKIVRNAADFYQLIGKDLGVEVIHEHDDRSHADPSDSSISLRSGCSPKSRKESQFHEMGHFTEFRSPSSGLLAKIWIEKRAEGEARSLAELTGNSGYTADETALPDKFIHSYVGKVYPGAITEVHSMGLGSFADGHSVVNLFKQDREHFDLMIRYIRQ